MRPELAYFKMSAVFLSGGLAGIAAVSSRLTLWPASARLALCGGIAGAAILPASLILQTWRRDRAAFSYGAYGLVPLFGLGMGWFLGSLGGAALAWARGSGPGGAIPVTLGIIAAGTVATPGLPILLGFGYGFACRVYECIQKQRKK